MNASAIALAGATGDLGERILKALVSRGAQVLALVRPDADEHATDRITTLGATVARADPTDVESLAKALQGAACVVSALNGLREVIVDRQTMLLNGAVRAGVPRFIPSDYSADFTNTAPGGNRNFDLRREFMSRADQAPLQVTSILNGAFLDMLGNEMPIIQARMAGERPILADLRKQAALGECVEAFEPQIGVPIILEIAERGLAVRHVQQVREHHLLLRPGLCDRQAQVGLGPH